MSLMIGSVIGAVLLLVYALWYMQISNATRDGLKETALAVARTIGRYAAGEARTGGAPRSSRSFSAGAGHYPPQATCCTLSLPICRVFAIRIRTASIIGKPFIGHDIQPTLQEKRMSPSTTGCWPRRYSVFTPVFNERHQQIGVVVVGISLSKVDEQIANSRWDVLLTILFSALVCALGTEPGSRPEARAAGAGAARNIHPVSAASGHASRPQGGVVAVDAHGEGKSHQPRGGRDPLSGPDKTLVHSPLLDDPQTVPQSGEPMSDRELGVQWSAADRQYSAHSQPGCGGRRHLYLP